MDWYFFKHTTLLDATIKYNSKEISLFQRHKNVSVLDSIVVLRANRFVYAKWIFSLAIAKTKLVKELKKAVN